MDGYPSTRAEAKAQGATYYFTGKPCKYGHVAPRYTSSKSCWQCLSRSKREWEARNPDKRREQDQRHYAKYREHKRELARRWYAENREQRRRYNRSEHGRARFKRWKQANAERCRVYAANRHAAKLQRTPPWANQERIAAMYAAAHEIQEQTGVEIHVDHVLPLQSDEVCGLHCEANLQLLPADVNLSKHNRLDESYLDEAA